MREGKSTGPRRSVVGGGGIRIDTVKDNVSHGLSLNIDHELIYASIYKDGTHIFGLNFNSSGKVSAHHDPENMFPEVTPAMFLK